LSGNANCRALCCARGSHNYRNRARASGRQLSSRSEIHNKPPDYEDCPQFLMSATGRKRNGR
jgi:hypothetical protein